MDKVSQTLLLLLGPFGVFLILNIIIKKIVIGNKFSSFLHRDLEKRFESKFDAAYQQDDRNEIIKLESDVIYARLEELSKPKVTHDRRRIHIEMISAWSQKRKFLGDKKQIDLLIKGLDANRRDPKLLSAIANHLARVANSMSCDTTRQNDYEALHVENYRIFTIINIWVTIILSGAYIFISDSFDKVDWWIPSLLFLFLIISLYKALPKILPMQRAVNMIRFILALAITVAYFYTYSYFKHVVTDPIRQSLNTLPVDIEYPQWLTASDLKVNGAKCTDKSITLFSNNVIPGFDISYDENEFELLGSFDEQECPRIDHDSNIIPMDKVYILNIRPKSFNQMISNASSTVKLTWFDPSNNKLIEEIIIDIRFENPLWYFCRRFAAYLIAGGGIIAYFLDIVKLKVQEA